jgi:hypothetical protein
VPEGLTEPEIEPEGDAAPEQVWWIQVRKLDMYTDTQFFRWHPYFRKPFR